MDCVAPNLYFPAKAAFYCEKNDLRIDSCFSSIALNIGLETLNTVKRDI